MHRLLVFFYSALTLTASWYFGYFLLLDGPQGSHGDMEILLSASIAVAAFLIGIFITFIVLKRRASESSFVQNSFFSVFISLITFPIVLGVGYFFSLVLIPVYCKMGPSSPSALFYQNCE